MKSIPTAQILILASMVFAIIAVIVRMIYEKVRDYALTRKPVWIYSVVKFEKNHILIKRETEFTSMVKFRIFYHIVKTKSKLTRLWKNLTTHARSVAKQTFSTPGAIR